MTSLPETHRQEARPGDRSRHLRRLPGLRDKLQGMERRRLFRAADRPGRPRRRSARRLAQPRAFLRGRRRRAKAAPCISRAPACIARRRPASPSARPARRTSAPSDGIVLVNPDTCIGCKLCSWACPYGAREYDYDDGVMKKCTLCVDRIYNETFAPEDRVPACVRACPTGARHFGDLGDPDSAVSQLVQGARRLRPAAGDGLQAGQQVSAAAAAPRPERRAGAAGRRAAGRPLRLARRSLLRLGRQDPGALNSTDASRLFGHRLHHGLGRRLWPADLACASRRRSNLVPRDPVLGFFGLGVALALITIGLLTSTLHLGRPERAWRALSQWRIVVAVARRRRRDRHLSCRPACSGSAGCSASSCRARSPSARGCRCRARW